MKVKTIQKLIVITFSLILISSSAFSVENNQLADDVFQPAEYKKADQIKIENILLKFQIQHSRLSNLFNRSLSEVIVKTNIFTEIINTAELLKLSEILLKANHGIS